MPYNPYQTYPYQQPLDNLGQLRMWQQQQATGINWVQGIDAAKAYIVAAGNSVLLLDSESQNTNTRAILDQMCNDKIQALRDENSTLKLAASQQAQNNVLMGAMQNQTNEVLARTAPIPVPAYQVPAPYNVVPPVGGVPCPGV